MSETELIRKLSAALAQQIRPQFPLEIDLWDMEIVAAYLKRSVQVVRERIACKPGFPKAIRLNGNAHPLYNASEVVAWANSFKEKN